MSMNLNVNSLSTIEKTNLVKQTYNDIAEKYAEIFFEDHCDDKYVDKFLKDLSGTKILDAGCGVGRECKFAQEKGFEATGIDFAKEIIKEAKNKYSKGNFEVMDVTSLSFQKESFDGIIFINTLFHLPKEQIDLAFSELNRVLKKDGNILLIFQEGDTEMIIAEPLKEGSYTYMHHYTFEFIKSKLNEYNLKIYDYERELVNDKNCPIDKKLVLYVTKK